MDLERLRSSKKKTEKKRIHGTITTDVGEGDWFVDFGPSYGMKVLSRSTFIVTHPPAFDIPPPPDYLSPDEEEPIEPINEAPPSPEKAAPPKPVTPSPANNYGLGMPPRQLSLTQMVRDKPSAYCFEKASHKKIRNYTSRFAEAKRKSDEYKKKQREFEKGIDREKKSKRPKKDQPRVASASIPKYYSESDDDDDTGIDASSNPKLIGTKTNGLDESYQNVDNDNNSFDAVLVDNHRELFGQDDLSSDDESNGNADDDDDTIVMIDPRDVCAVYDEEHDTLMAMADVDISESAQKDLLQKHEDGEMDAESIGSVDTALSSNATMTSHTTNTSEDYILVDELCDEFETVKGTAVVEPIREATRFTLDDLGKVKKTSHHLEIDKVRTFHQLYYTDSQMKDEITDLVGEDVLVGDKVWTHVDVHVTERERRERLGLRIDEPQPGDDKCSFDDLPELVDADEPQYVGIRGFNFERGKSFDHVEYFNAFLPGDPSNHVMKVNHFIDLYNKSIRKTRNGPKRYIKHVMVSEYYSFIAIMLIASVVHGSGTMLWKQRPESILTSKLVAKFMSKRRFKEIRRFISFVMCEPDLEDKDAWWRVSSFIEEYNKQRMEHVTTSNWKTIDESMCAFRPRTSKTGGLPHITYIL